MVKTLGQTAVKDLILIQSNFVQNWNFSEFTLTCINCNSYQLGGFNPIQDLGQKAPQQFFPYPKNFLTFSFSSFTLLVSNFKAISSANPKLLNLNQAHLSKKLFLLVKCL